MAYEGASMSACLVSMCDGVFCGIVQCPSGRNILEELSQGKLASVRPTGQSPAVPAVSQPPAPREEVGCHGNTSSVIYLA